MNQWIISDTHFDHANIIKFCNRPFKDANHMNEVLIERWNNRVKPNDLIYHLGDVGLTKADAVAKHVARLNGKKILIVGNHDKTAQRMMDYGFDFACEQMVIIVYNRRLLLNHRPLLTKPADIDYVLHGHIHNSTAEERRKLVKKSELAELPAFNVNLSVEVINYEPVSLTALVGKLIRPV